MGHHGVFIDISYKAGKMVFCLRKEVLMLFPKIFDRKNALDGVLFHFHETLRHKGLDKTIKKEPNEEKSKRDEEPNKSGKPPKNDCFDVKTDVWKFPYGRVEVLYDREKNFTGYTNFLTASEVKFVHTLCDRDGNEHMSDEVGVCVHIEVLRRKRHSYGFNVVTYAKDSGYRNQSASLFFLPEDKAAWFADNAGEFVGGLNDMNNRIEALMTRPLYFDEVDAHEERLFTKNGNGKCVFHKKECV